MPRDGSGIYTAPFPDVQPGTTIESAVYNGFVNDVAIDLNAARPIIAGGTGAVNATDALFNLKGMLAAYAVTNFDTHVWYPGSFRSTAAATNPPVPGHAFAGVAYIFETLANPPTNNNVIVEARDLDDTDNPGLVWVRQKTAGVWGAWAVETAAQLALKVNKAGDTMTGALTLPSDPVNPLEAAPKQYVDATATSVATSVATTIAADTTKAFRNYVFNSAMVIAQEFCGVVSSVNGAYIVDNFRQLFNAGAVDGVRAVSNTPGGSAHRLRVTVSTANAAPAAGHFCFLRCSLEGFEVADLLAGTASAKNITLSFGCQGPAGQYAVAFFNAANNRFRHEVFTITGPEANTPVRKSVTLPLDTAGTWERTNLAGLTIDWVLFAGTTFQGTPSVWSATQALASAGQFNFMGTLGNVFELFDVYLHQGTVAQTFHMPDAGETIRKCQRQLAKTFDLEQRILQNSNQFNGSLVYGTGTYSTGNAPAINWRLPVAMRAVPTVTVYTPGIVGGASVMSDRFGGANTYAPGTAFATSDSVHWANPVTAGTVITPCLHAGAFARL